MSAHPIISDFSFDITSLIVSITWKWRSGTSESSFLLALIPEMVTLFISALPSVVLTPFRLKWAFLAEIPDIQVTLCKAAF